MECNFLIQFLIDFFFYSFKLNILIFSASNLILRVPSLPVREGGRGGGEGVENGEKTIETTIETQEFDFRLAWFKLINLIIPSGREHTFDGLCCFTQYCAHFWRD